MAAAAAAGVGAAGRGRGEGRGQRQGWGRGRWRGAEARRGGEAAAEAAEGAAPSRRSPEEQAKAGRGAEAARVAKAEAAAARKLEAQRAEVKARLKKAQALAKSSEKLALDLRGGARGSIWKNVKLVACTASSALQVSRRLQRDMVAEGGTLDKDDKEGPLTFDFVILDEAAAMLEPDAIGCLLHGARAALLVGDQRQLPPFSKWKDADTAHYTVSLMARLAASPTPAKTRRPRPRRRAARPRPRAGGGRRQGRRRRPAGGPPTFLLTEQYRMHPTINKLVSSTFYQSKLVTAAPTVRARQHPLPACFVNMVGSREEFQQMSCFNTNEAHAVLAVARHCVGYLGFAPEQVNILTFYNAQRDLIEKLVARDGLPIDVVSVDAMQGREADAIIPSCVRADVAGGLGFVADARRVNVALSRARESLIVVGTSRCLEAERIWHSSLKGMRCFEGAAEYQKAIEAALAPGWAKPRDFEIPARDPKAERTSADREFEEPTEEELKVERLEQRDSGVPDDWDCETDEEGEAAPEPPDDWESQSDGGDDKGAGGLEGGVTIGLH